MFKISRTRQTVLEEGLIEVVRFPRGWKDYTDQLWNLGRENLTKLVRVMDPNFKDMRLYKSERIDEAPPGVIELPRYYAIGINKNGDWYTEDGILVGMLPLDIMERARQKLTVNPLTAAIRETWFPVLAASLFFALVGGLLTGELMPSNISGSIILAIGKAWLRIGLPFCGAFLFVSTMWRIFKRTELRNALNEACPPPSDPQPTSSPQTI